MNLFTAMFDDAALFPPTDAPMPDAILSHRRQMRDHAEYVGPFVVPAARLDEFAQALSADPGPIAISLICPPAQLTTATARISQLPGVTLSAVELSVLVDAAAAHVAAQIVGDTLSVGVAVSAEVPRTDEAEPVLDVLAAHGLRAKLRTGGIRADLFPTVDELAGTIAGCVERGVTFKCTAGLHNAVRHTAADTGFVHHGFLNVLSAAAALGQGGTVADAETALSQEDSRRLAAEIADWPDGLGRLARSCFVSFGTCSVAEPLTDLAELGLLDLAISA